MNLDTNTTLKNYIYDSNQIYGLSGIVNTANTCYMNSALQAFSHNYALTSYLFNKKKEILAILKKNASKILKNTEQFKLECKISIVPIELRQKIQNVNFDSSTLTSDETNIILNFTITAQLIHLLEKLWTTNCIVIPTSFRKIFCEARSKFFYGHEQHDAEEAYSCILQKMQEELAEEKNIKFRITKSSVQEFLHFKNNIITEIKETSNLAEKQSLINIYIDKKNEMLDESLTIEAFREMKKYYDGTYSIITEIFSGFLHSSINCPTQDCKYSSNKFDPFLHLSLPLPLYVINNEVLTIYDCMNEFCKKEILDEQNLWLCERCNKKVRGIKRLQLWTAPPVLVIQFKRFSVSKISKDYRFVKYPTEHFDISSIISPIQLDPIKCNTYRLQCVINHRGHLGSGHYYTYCLDEDSGKWFEFNDRYVTEISKDKIITDTAYLLFYNREDLINY